jgi:hypothetical protein
MKLITPPFVLIAALVFMLLSCKHDIINDPNEKIADTTKVVTPAGSTSTADTVCFNTEILPLFSSYCGSSGCHDLNSHAEGVILTDYTRIMRGIRAKLPNSSKYYTIIGQGMPPRNSPQMSVANIATIKKWIEQGALNTQCTNVCDTTVFTFAGAVKTIFESNCNGCHGNKPGTANIYLGDYASIKSYITANKTLFLNSINHRSTILSKNMPQSGKMVQCKITQIEKWINNGYPQ